MKFHINSKKEPAPCTATKKACPLGENTTHFDSAEEAAEFAFQQALEQDLQGFDDLKDEEEEAFAAYKDNGYGLVPKGEYLTPAEFKKISLNTRGLGEAKLTAEEKRRAWPGYIKGLNRSVRGVGIGLFLDSSTTTLDYEGLTDEQVEDLKAAMAAPLRLTPGEKARANQTFSEMGLEVEDLKAWAEEQSGATMVIRGEVVPLHWSRHVGLRGCGLNELDMGFNEQSGEVIAKWKAERDAGKKPVREPSHPYNRTHLAKYDPTDAAISDAYCSYESASKDATYYDWLAEAQPTRAKAAKELAEESRAKADRAVKELDPAMIEKLKLKYLGKFKQPFDESGLSIPELLQMAGKGELD